MRKIHTLVRYLGISDGNMQEGSFRCDANISIRPSGQEALGTRAEIKNINSFRFVERAIDFEIERQTDVLEGGGTIVQETRLYDADRDETRSMRSKEEANDYRYFPDPDLLPVEIDAQFIASLREQLPELPQRKRQRFIEQFGLRDSDASQLTASREMADYFEAVVAAAGLAVGNGARLAANWIIGELAGAMNNSGTDLIDCPLSPERLAGLLQRIDDGTVSGKTAKDVFEAMWNGNEEADRIIDQRGLKQVSDSGAIEDVIDRILAANPDQVEQFRAGKTKVKGFFVGQVMQAFKGQANPAEVNKILARKLGA